ncbi:MAG: type II secretion system F family protein, partial [Planctomycetaceae bacterium]
MADSGGGTSFAGGGAGPRAVWYHTGSHQQASWPVIARLVPLSSREFGMPPALSTADLLAFNDELSALVAAGLPLPQGLAGLARRRGALGLLAGRLQTRLAQGESLTAALQHEGPAIPAEYAAVVRAGERAGRLPVALDSLATLGSEMLQLRRMLGNALRPMVLVLLVAYGLTLLVGTDLVRRYLLVFDDFGLATSGVAWWLARAALLLERGWWLPLLGLAV